MRSKCIIAYLVVLSFVAGASLTAVAAQKPQTVAELALYTGADRQKILEEGAKKEGKLTFYTTSTEDQYRPIVRAFQQKYPYIQVNVWRASTSAIIPRITEEYATGKLIVDVVRVSGAGGIILRENNLLQPYHSPEIPNMEDDVVIKSSDGKGALLVGNCGSVQGLGYNTQMVSPKIVPKSYQDLLDPRWKGKMAIVGSSQGPAWMGAVLSTFGMEFLEKLARQEMSVHMISARALASLIIAKEVAMSPTITDAHTLLDKSRGALVDWVPLEPANVTLGQMALPIRAPNPHAALLFLDMELSKEAGLMYEAISYDSPRKDIPGAIAYKKFYGAKSTKEIKEWTDTFQRLFLTK